MTKPRLEELFKKGYQIVESKSGFTKKAIEYRSRYHKSKKLYYDSKKI